MAMEEEQSTRAHAGNWMFRLPCWSLWQRNLWVRIIGIAGDLEKLRIMLCEMDAMQEQIVEGYLEKNRSENVHGSRSAPTEE